MGMVAIANMLLLLLGFLMRLRKQKRIAGTIKQQLDLPVKQVTETR